MKGFSLLLSLTLLALLFQFHDGFAESTPDNHSLVQVVIRGGDGGSWRERHLKKLSHFLSEHHCPAHVKRIAGDAVIPADTQLIFSPWPLKTEQTKPFQPLLRAQTIDGKRQVAGALLVQRTTGLDDLALLAGEPIAFVTAYSPTGYHLPMELLAKATVTPNSKNMSFARNHSGSVALLLHHEVQAAALAAPLAKEWSEDGELLVLAQSKAVETGGWWIHESITNRWSQPCQSALRDLSGSGLKPFPDWIGGFVLP